MTVGRAVSLVNRRGACYSGVMPRRGWKRTLYVIMVVLVALGTIAYLALPFLAF